MSEFDVPSQPSSEGERPHPHLPVRITGWAPANPPAVERSFRAGFRLGASRGARDELAVAGDLINRLLERRGDLCWEREVWSDRRAALLRGALQGGLEAVRARVRGVKTGLLTWLEKLHAWSSENPIRLDWFSARPPAPPDPDSPPLDRDLIPRQLWPEIFGMRALLNPSSVAPARSPRSVDAAGKPVQKPQTAVPAPPRGNFERVPLPDPAVQGAVTSAPAEVQVPAVSPFEPIPVMVRLADVQPELVRWLWPGRIALGKLTLLCGDPGLGKSFLALDIGARVSRGNPWPDLPLAPERPGGVVLLSAEDDLADTIRPRLDAAGADAARVVAIQAVRRMCSTGKVQESHFDLTDDLPALEMAIRQTCDCRLAIIDPLTAYLGRTDSHKNAEVRAVLAKLFELAARRKVAILAVTHLNKASTLPAIYRAMGSLAFVAAARAVWAVVRDEQEPTGRRRLFVPIKNNLGSDETGLAYALESVSQTARVQWESDPVSIRADDALDGGGRKAKVRHDVRQFVIDTIAANGGDMLSDDLATAAEVSGISERTLWRAKKSVAVSYKEKGRGGRWRCKLKGCQEDGPDTNSKS